MLDNTLKICDICGHIKMAADRIVALSNSFENISSDIDPELVSLLDSQRLDELEHIQLLMLSLTNLVVPYINEDDGEGSVFAEGELTDNLGDKTDCTTDVVKT